VSNDNEELVDWSNQSGSKSATLFSMWSTQTGGSFYAWWPAGRLRICADGGANRMYDELPGILKDEDPSAVRTRSEFYYSGKPGRIVLYRGLLLSLFRSSSPPQYFGVTEGLGLAFPWL
jgi:hypothetical protein